MSKQLKTPSLTGSPVSIWFDADWDEYQVRVKGKPKATYHTSDKRDALQTAQRMRNQISPPAQTPAVDPGGSSAGLVGNPPFIRLYCLNHFGPFEYVCHLHDLPRWKNDLGSVIQRAELVGSLV